jgi:hypothetical protein
MFAYYFYLHVYLHNCAPFVIIMHIHLFASHLHLMFVGLDDMGNSLQYICQSLVYACLILFTQLLSFSLLQHQS